MASRNITLLGIFAFLIHFVVVESTLLPPILLSFKLLGKDPVTLQEGVNQFDARNSSHDANHQSPQITVGVIQSNICPYTSKDASDLLDSIDTVVNSFFAKNAQKIANRLDAGFGLGILKGQLNILLADRPQKLSPQLKTLFGQLRGASAALESQLFNQVLNMDLDSVTRKGMEAIQRNGNIFNGLGNWQKFDTIKNHFDEFPSIGSEKEGYGTLEHFKCITGMVDDCSVPQNCKSAYMEDIGTQYMLTHQVLYQQFAEHRSCALANPEEFKNAQIYRNRLCSKTYLEAEFLQANNYPTRFIDLFAEQVGLCGLMGYPNFMRADWLREILSRREGSVSGCIPSPYEQQENTDKIVPVTVVDKNGGLSEEKCVVHLTTVSLMAMSMNLRYMVDVCEPSLFDGYFAA